MRKNKFIYTLPALMMACIISFSGASGSYMQVYATSVGIPRPSAWNDDVSVWENIRRYIDLYMAYQGVYINPANTLFTAQDFYDFMLNDGVSHDVAHGIFCDCDDSSHTSFSGQEHGGGGFVRDGITQDDDGNVTYSDEVSDLFHGYIQDYLDSNCGYMLIGTMTVDDIAPSYFSSEEAYNNFKSTVNSFDIIHVSLLSDGKLRLSYIPTSNLYTALDFSVLDFRSEGVYYYYAAADGYYPFSFYVLEDDWSFHYPYYLRTAGSSSDYSDLSLDASYSLSDLDVNTSKKHTNCTFSLFESNYFYSIFTKDGRNIKLWNNLDAFKNYDVGYQPYYVTNTWNSYNSADDNSVTLTQQEFQYYTDNSTTIYQNIQNNIDNSSDSDLTEQDVQDIVDDAVDKIKDEINNGSGDDSGNGSTSDNDAGGSGIGDLFDGIGKIFDTILSLLGKFFGVVADFTQSILDLFSGFTTFTDGFSQFLAGAFGFIPAEIWNVIQAGLSLMVLAAIIKFLRK